jgi:ectoine hydroxylase-related dioxygenase (phytanoyl-CoA dioxygenase family)
MTAIQQGLARRLTADEVDYYQEHGIVHLKQIFSPPWIATVEHVFRLVLGISDPMMNVMDMGQLAVALEAVGIELLDKGEAPGDFKIASYNWNRIPELAALLMGTPLPELAAELMRSSRINFFGDQLFAKGPKSNRRTAFHQDAPYYHFTGDQCCSIWIPLDEVDQENGAMGYVRGSHRWPIYAANSFASQTPLPGSTEQPLPNIEADEAKFDVAYFDVKPGDALVHHVRTAHGSRANTSATRARRALVARYVGDDVRYFERESAPPTALKSASLKDGDRLDSSEWPLLWTAAGGYEASPAAGPALSEILSRGETKGEILEYLSGR